MERAGLVGWEVKFFRRASNVLKTKTKTKKHFITKFVNYHFKTIKGWKTWTLGFPFFLSLSFHSSTNTPTATPLPLTPSLMSHPGYQVTLAYAIVAGAVLMSCGITIRSAGRSRPLRWHPSADLQRSTKTFSSPWQQFPLTPFHIMHWQYMRQSSLLWNPQRTLMGDFSMN